MLHVALYSGVYVRADAISTSLRYKVDALRRLVDAGAPLRVTVFTHGSDYGDPWVQCVGSMHELLSRPEFHGADVHLFEYGIHYDLFNSVFVLPPGRPTLAVYHNVTPPELVDDALVRQTLERSLVQKHNLACVDRVACVSEFNRDDLLATGLDPARLSVLHLPPAVEVHPGVPAPPRGDHVELLYVGRFVPAKGLPDLVEAVVRLHRRGTAGFRLTLAGNPTFSSGSHLEEVTGRIASEGLGELVRVVLSPDDAELAALYLRADALVMPSYHEGYCMPVVEAQSAGCFVIAYDSTNLPNVVDGVGALVPTGDVDRLTDAIGDYVARVQSSRRSGAPLHLPTAAGDVDEQTWRGLLHRHLERYSPAAYIDGLCELLRWAAGRAPRGEALLRWMSQQPAEVCA